MLSLSTALLISAVACSRYQYEEEKTPTKQIDTKQISDKQSDTEHPHRTGAIASLGDDQYHAEAMLLSDQQLAIYLFGADETRVQEVPQQVLTAYIKTAEVGQAAAMTLNAAPMSGDSDGSTLRFVGTLPERLTDQSLFVVVPNLRIDDERFAVRFEIPQVVEAVMPTAVADDAAQELYLTSGGLYTDHDIQANGRVTAGEKYQSFQAQHDPNPAPDDIICPITKTKANLKCSWIIGGETYYFCCPPCIDEFLATAKVNPQQVLAADAYRK